ncbi:MAG TPA: hypothetical protein VHU61_19370 [Solirubrobacteraceae bacterium]|jgi:hypothetical protein|nr:hypothetical protein [Solirubrobacteraceae bacterium]
MVSEDLTPLLDHLESSGVSRGQAARLVDDVLAYFSETPEEFVRRRHRELQSEGVANATSFTVIARELGQRRVVGPQLSERQIRRVIYG